MRPKMYITVLQYTYSSDYKYDLGDDSHAALAN